VVILLINLLFFLVLFTLLAHGLTWTAAWHLFLQRTGQAYLYTWAQIGRGGTGFGGCRAE
jgi:hypothetical protein